MILFEVPVSTQTTQTVGILRGKIFLLNDLINFSPRAISPDQLSEVHGFELVHAGTETVVSPDARENQQRPRFIVALMQLFLIQV